MPILAFGIALLLAGRPVSVDEFAQDWKGRGQRLAASKPWLSERRILVLVEPDVAQGVAAKTADAVREQLRALGSTRMTVAWYPLPKEAFGGCQKDGIMDMSCFDRSVPELRKVDPQAASSILFIITNAALGSKMKPLPDGRGTSGPPAGRASWPDGWAVTSEYYLLLNTGQMKGQAWIDFSDHARASTAKHEVVHILGLGHHEHIPNPGLPEPAEGDQCKHVILGPPRAECLMRCGSGDDDWAHIQTHGKSFGLCARCRLAAASALAGIEGR